MTTTKQYTVECRGDARELYVVDATSPEDAMVRWHEGENVLIEVLGSEPVSATADEE